MSTSVISSAVLGFLILFKAPYVFVEGIRIWNLAHFWLSGGVTIELENLGDVQLSKEITACIEHALSDSSAILSNGG